jgi:hypothetical protein
MLNAESIVGVIGLALEAALLILLLWRQLYRKFAFFVLYISFVIATTALDLWFMAQQTTSFFSFYWITEAVLGILELLVLREAFMPALWMEYEQNPWLRFVPPAALLTIAGTALWRAVYRPFRQGPFAHLAAGAYAFELGVNLLEVAIFLFSLRLVRREFHPMRNLHRFAIVAGLGLIACAYVLPDLVRLQAYNSNSHAAAALDSILRHLPPAAYVGVLIIWLLVFLRPLPAKSPAKPEEIERRLQSQQKIQERLRPKEYKTVISN